MTDGADASAQTRALRLSDRHQTHGFHRFPQTFTAKPNDRPAGRREISQHNSPQIYSFSLACQICKYQLNTSLSHSGNSSHSHSTEHMTSKISSGNKPLEKHRSLRGSWRIKRFHVRLWWREAGAHRFTALFSGLNVEDSVPSPPPSNNNTKHTPSSQQASEREELSRYEPGDFCFVISFITINNNTYIYYCIIYYMYY